MNELTAMIALAKRLLASGTAGTLSTLFSARSGGRAVLPEHSRNGAGARQGFPRARIACRKESFA